MKTNAKARSPRRVNVRPLISAAAEVAGIAGMPHFFAGPAALPAFDANNPAPYFEAMNKAVEEMRQAINDNEKKYDGVTAERIEKLNNAISTLEAATKKAVEEQNAAIARLTAGGSSGGKEEQIKNAKLFRLHHVANITTSGKAIDAAMAEAPNVEAYLAYVEAYDRLIAANHNINALPAKFRDALAEGADPTGGYTVPPERAAGMIKRLYETSPFRQFAGATRITGKRWEQMSDTDDGVSGGWVGEKAARPETGTPTLGVIGIEVHEQYAYPHITQTMLEDASLLDIQAWLESKTDDKMIRVETTGFFTGNGKNKPRGFLDYAGDAVTTTDKAGRAWDKVQYIALGSTGFPALSSGSDNPDALIDIIMSMNPTYRQRAAWAMNRLTLGKVRKLKDANGHYFWQPGLTAGAPSKLLDYPIMEAEDMPDWASGTVPIAFADWGAAYLIVDRLGLTTLVDPYTKKPYVGFYMRRRVGGDLINTQAIKFGKAA